MALAFLLGAFLISPALGAILSFVGDCCGGVELYGLWLGLIGGYTVTTVLALFATLKADWPRLACLAQKRSEAVPAAEDCRDDCQGVVPAEALAEGTEGCDVLSAAGCINAAEPSAPCPQLAPLDAAALPAHHATVMDGLSADPSSGAEGSGAAGSMTAPLLER